MAIVVEYTIFAGKQHVFHKFEKSISATFDVGWFSTNRDIFFNRLLIRQHPEYLVSFNMNEFLSSVSRIDAWKSRRKQNDVLCTVEEIRAYQGLTGNLKFLGHGVLLLASVVASEMQQHVKNLKVSHVRQLNAALVDIRSHNPSITFKAPESLLSLPSIAEFRQVLRLSDAASSTSPYGKTEALASISLRSKSNTIYHYIDWNSAKQKRILFS